MTAYVTVLRLPACKATPDKAHEQRITTRYEHVVLELLKLRAVAVALELYCCTRTRKSNKNSCPRNS